MAKAIKQLEKIDHGTLVTGDGLSTPPEILQVKDDTSLLVKSLIDTGGDVLLNLVLNSKKQNLLANASGIFSSNVLDIRSNIDKYLIKFKKFLESYSFPEQYIEISMKKMRYELFYSWLQNLLITCGFKIPEKFLEVPENLKNEISNILRGEDELASLLIFMKSCGLIEISDNAGNKFEEESELKILEVNKSDLISRLEEIGAKKVFEGTIQDEYYEFPDRRLEKYKQTLGESMSFRLREKMDIEKEGDVTMYYTIKRKRKSNPEPTFRVCNEKELEILNYTKVLQLLEKFGLQRDRTKLKQRTSFFMRDKDDENIGVKFDIDDYGTVEIDGKKIEIPTLLEIETNSKILAEYYIKRLGLEGNVKFAHGSRSTFRYYIKKQEEKTQQKPKKTKKN